MKTPHLEKFSLISALFLVVLLSVALFVWRFARPRGAPVLVEAAAQDSDAGLPVQKARTESYIERVAQEDTFEELAAGLDEHEDLLVAVSMWSQEPVPEQMFETCLANRRLARMMEILRTRDDADALCRELFQSKLASLHRVQSVILDGWEQGAFWDEDGSVRFSKEHFKEGAKLGPLHIAVSGALFLSAEFCPTEEFLKQLDGWNAMAEASAERCRAGHPRMRGALSSVERHAGPQSRYQLSLLASTLDRRFDIDPASVLPKWLPYRRVPLCAWDAETNPYDFLHQARFVPVDRSEAFGEFTVFSNWSVAMSGEQREAILNDLRQALLQAAAKASEPANDG